MQHFENWPRHMPLVCHAEGQTTAAVLFLANTYNRSVHIAHVSTREQVGLVVVSIANAIGF